MKERPILFSAPMVRALLDGTKTQTRRVVKPQPPAHMQTARNLGDGNWQFVNDVHMLADAASTWRCPYGQPGDRLWVREKWRGVVNIAPPGSYEYAVAHHIPDQITIDRALIGMALDALQVELQNYDGPVPHIDCAITALREALAQPQQTVSTDRIVECAKRLVDHSDSRLGGCLSADSKASEIPSNAVSHVKARHLAALRAAISKSTGETK